MTSRVRELRTAARMSQTALAVRSGVNPSRISNIESGVKCNRQTAVRLAAALGKSPATVFPTFTELRPW